MTLTPNFVQRFEFLQNIILRTLVSINKCKRKGSYTSGSVMKSLFQLLKLT